jgi:hypothetical protein
MPAGAAGFAEFGRFGEFWEERGTPGKDRVVTNHELTFVPATLQ